MPFVASVNLGTVGDDITSVKLYACVNNECTDCTELPGYEEVLVSSFPMSVAGIPLDTLYIKADSIGRCEVSQCIPIVGIPTSTPTPTPTSTPTPTPTSTPDPTSTPTPTPTSTPGPTSTPTPTPTSTPEPTSTPTPTPTSTPTPTPTSTPTQVPGCINISYSSGGGTTTCLGNSYPYTTESVIFQLTDGSGTPINATSQITIELDTISRPCGTSSFEQVVTLYINVGENTTQYNYTSGQYVECGFSECVLESEEYIGVRSISGSYEICETPTPTPTSTPQPFNWKCNNGNCTEVFDGSGDYLTQQDCIDNCQQQIYYCQQTVGDPCGIYQQPCGQLGLIDCDVPTSS